MAAVELDPVFVRALKLLQSKAKDSTAQLKSLLDDAIAQRKGIKVPTQAFDADKSSSTKAKYDEDSRRKESEKRSSDKSSKDSSEPEAKKVKIDSSKSRLKEEKEFKEKEKEKERAKKEKERKDRDEKEFQKQREKLEREKKEKEMAVIKQETDITIVSDEEGPSSQMDAGDFALEMGIACVVCRQFDVSSGNQLVECQECHSLYHQECHKPPVTEEDVSDPRFVWYCSRCARSLKKMVAQKPIKLKPNLAIASLGKDSSGQLSKGSKPEVSSSSQAFRKIDPKTIVSTKELSTTAKPMVGLAGLAANLAKPRIESKSNSSSRKSDQKGDGLKSSSKSEGKSSGYKSDSSSKSSSSRSEEKSSSNSKSSSSSSSGSVSSSKEEKEKKSEHKPSKSEDKKLSDSSSKQFSSQVSKEEKKVEVATKSLSSSDLKSDKSNSGKSPKHAGLGKLDIPSAKLSPTPISTSITPTTPDSPSSLKSLTSSSNKQAIANLSMVTANKRIQMMKKKAQTKPQDKKHIK